MLNIGKYKFLIFAGFLFFMVFSAVSILTSQKNNEISESTNTPLPTPNVVQIVETHALANGYKKPVITVDFINETQGRGNISDEAVLGGGKWFAAKINNEWQVVHIGNGLPKCSDVEKYNLPKDFLSCY